MSEYEVQSVKTERRVMDTVFEGKSYYITRNGKRIDNAEYDNPIDVGLLANTLNKETDTLRQRVQELEAENETLHSQIQRALELLAGYHESLIGSTPPTAIDFQSINHAIETEQE